MAARLLASSDLGPIETWLPVLVGVATALAFIVVYWLARRRQPPESPADAVPDPPAEANLSERRTSRRRKGHSIAVWISNETAQDRPIAGLVADRSVEGLGLAVAQPFTIGTILCVRPAGAPAAAGWVQLEVKNCRQTESGWELGCRYVHSPPWSTRMLFG